MVVQKSVVSLLTLDHRVVVVTTSARWSTSCEHFLVRKEFSIITLINLCSIRRVLLLETPADSSALHSALYDTVYIGSKTLGREVYFFCDSNIKMACFLTLSDFTDSEFRSCKSDRDRLYKLYFMAFTPNYTIHSFLCQDLFQQNKLYLYKRL